MNKEKKRSTAIKVRIAVCAALISMICTPATALAEEIQTKRTSPDMCMSEDGYYVNSRIRADGTLHLYVLVDGSSRGVMNGSGTIELISTDLRDCVYYNTHAENKDVVGTIREVGEVWKWDMPLWEGNYITSLSSAIRIRPIFGENEQSDLSFLPENYQEAVEMDTQIYQERPIVFRIAEGDEIDLFALYSYDEGFYNEDSEEALKTWAEGYFSYKADSQAEIDARNNGGELIRVDNKPQEEEEPQEVSISEGVVLPATGPVQAEVQQETETKKEIDWKTLLGGAAAIAALAFVGFFYTKRK